MKEVRTIIETEPLYNAVVREMSPILKIEAEVQTIIKAAAVARSMERLQHMGYDKAILLGDWNKGIASTFELT